MLRCRAHCFGPDGRLGAAFSPQLFLWGMSACSSCARLGTVVLQGHRTLVAADMEELPEGLAADASEHRETWT